MKEMLTAPQVAKEFNVTTNTIYNWKKRGILPFIQIGRTIRFLRKDVDALLYPSPTQTVRDDTISLPSEEVENA